MAKSTYKSTILFKTGLQANQRQRHKGVFKMQFSRQKQTDEIRLGKKERNDGEKIERVFFLLKFE